MGFFGKIADAGRAVNNSVDSHRAGARERREAEQWAAQIDRGAVYYTDSEDSQDTSRGGRAFRFTGWSKLRHEPLTEDGTPATVVYDRYGPGFVKGRRPAGWVSQTEVAAANRHWESGDPLDSGALENTSRGVEFDEATYRRLRRAAWKGAPSAADMRRSMLDE